MKSRHNLYREVADHNHSSEGAYVEDEKQQRMQACIQGILGYHENIIY